MVRPFIVEDGIRLRGKTRNNLLDVGDEELLELQIAGDVYTILDTSNRPVAFGGVKEYWRGRGEAWIVIDRSRKLNFVAIHNTVKKFLETHPCRRVEAAVEVGFAQGHRWAKLLGFKREAPRLEAYLPGGDDCALYARVRHG